MGLTVVNNIDLKSPLHLIEQRGKLLIKKFAFQIVTDAQAIVVVDTGFLKNSIHAEFEDEGRTAWVIAGADYAVYVEMGTRRMSARPFLTPAFERARADFFTAFRALFL